MTHTDIQSAYSERREQKPTSLSLLIAVIRERPKASQTAHIAAWKKLLQSPGYEDYLDAALNKLGSLEYTIAYQAALPPSPKEVAKKAAERREQQKQQVEAAKETIAVRIAYLDFTLPNGKKLRDCTGAECLKEGGWLAKVGEKVGPRRIVGKVLTEKQLQDLR